MGVILIILSLLIMFIRLILYTSGKIYFVEWEFYSYQSIHLFILLIIDWIRIRFSGLVIIISSVVIIYLTSYIEGDINFVRFTWIVYLFVLSIILLILSPNIIRILLGWDGLGLVSYCLVIYYQNVKSANAGMLTILINRVGDVAILLSISWIFNFGGWNIYYLPFIFKQTDLLLIEILVILAALTKSAQVPFSAWLPAAIAAPTPVSALVHSSTLVTAGVYLLIRFRSLIETSVLLLLISIITILISGINANLEIDLKKVIALSTLRQLGVIIITISVGLVDIAFFHILSHALFKSLLFLCAGVVIHGIGDIQDVRDLGGVRKILPITSLYFLVCSFSLCGFPFISGFYSKDILLEIYFISEQLNFFILGLIIVRILLTRIYSVKLACILFIKPVGLKKINNLGEEIIIIYPISLLFYSSIVGGASIFWWFAPPILVFLNSLVKVGILFLVIILVGLAISLFLIDNLNKKIFYYKYIIFIGRIFFLPGLSSVLLIPLLQLGKFVIKTFDHGWLEYIGGQGIITNLKNLSLKIDILNALGLRVYLFLFIILILLILIIY